MSKLIAMVATAVLIGGVRTIIQPGEELPELPAHDERELTASGAAENLNAKAAQATLDSKTSKQLDTDFAAARQRVQQEQASLPQPDAKSA